MLADEVTYGSGRLPASTKGCLSILTYWFFSAVSIQTRSRSSHQRSPSWRRAIYSCRFLWTASQLHLFHNGIAARQLWPRAFPYDGPQRTWMSHCHLSWRSCGADPCLPSLQKWAFYCCRVHLSQDNRVAGSLWSRSGRVTFNCLF